jgi:alpha-L-fucosidase
MTMNHTWGFRSYDHEWKSTGTLVRNLVDIASKGGNFLLNVGPTSAGLIPGPSVDRLKEMGAWMNVNGAAIYGTSKSPLPVPPSWGRVTQKGDTLYLHVFDWPADGKLVVPGLKNSVAKAFLLKPNFFGWHKHLSTANEVGGVVVKVPAQAPDKISSTIVLKLNGAPELD